MMSLTPVLRPSARALPAAHIAGNDIGAGSGDDVIDACAKALGGGGDNTSVATNDISAGSGDDVVRSFVKAIGGEGVRAANVVQGEDGDDFIQALSEIVGGSDEDIHLAIEIEGGAGDDTIAATLRDDPGETFVRMRSEIHGGSGDDILSVEIDAPKIFFDFLAVSLLDGGIGSDQLFGSDFADRITGGSGADNVVGGLGDDTFEFARDNGTALDTVADFGTGNDLIDLSAFGLDLAGLEALLDESTGDVLELSAIGGRDVQFVNVDVASLSTDLFILG